MAAQPQERVRKRLAWLSPYLLAVALFPALLGFQYTCDRGDTYLLPLQVEVGGVDQIDSFHPDTRYYDIAISGDNVLLRAVTRDATSTASYQLLVDGTPVEGGQLGVGGGEVTLGVAVGQSTLRVSVRATEGGLGHYEVDVTRLPKFACTEQGILDAIAFGGGPHFFSCVGPTTVATQDEIVIDNDVILDGEGQLTVSGSGGAAPHRVFYVPSGNAAELVGIEITGGTIPQVGPPETSPMYGGGILNMGTLTLRRCAVVGNAAVSSTEQPRGYGGGLLSGGPLTIRDSVVAYNSADDGGGVFTLGHSTLVIDSEVSNNTAQQAGAAVTIGQLTFIRSNISNNSATDTGGIVNGQDLVLVNSTLSGNRSEDSGGAFRNNNNATTTIIGSTVAYNTGSHSVVNEGSMTMTSSLVDGDCSGAINSDGYNIESPGDTCGLSDPTDLVNVTAEDLKLGPLADNGGPTETHALLPGSVAIDHVPTAMCLDEQGQPLTEDQRGFARPQGAMCDVGAFESVCALVDCDDGDQCTADVCDQVEGTCTNDWLAANGTPCDYLGIGDGVCVSGVCVETPTDCNFVRTGSTTTPQSAVVSAGCSNNVTAEYSPLPFTLIVDAPVAIIAGAPFSVTLDGVGIFPEFLLDVAQVVTCGGFRTAELIDFVATVQVRSGATGPDVPLQIDPMALDPGPTIPTRFCNFPQNQVCAADSECLGGVCNPPTPSILLQDVPVLEGTPNSPGGCDPDTSNCPFPGPATDCDCSACDALGAAKAGQCFDNGFCQNGSLALPMESAVGNYTAAATGPVLWGWSDQGVPGLCLCPDAACNGGTGCAQYVQADGCYQQPPASFALPVPPIGIRGNAGGQYLGGLYVGGLEISIQCAMGEDGGTCSTTATQGCLVDADCPGAETCIGVGVDDDVICPTPDAALISCPIN